MLTRAKTPEEAFNEYIKSWGKLDVRRAIAEDDFVRHYSDLSGCIEREDLFEKTLKFPFNILM